MVCIEGWLSVLPQETGKNTSKKEKIHNVSQLNNNRMAMNWGSST
jgi:hypothetical protein